MGMSAARRSVLVAELMLAAAGPCRTIDDDSAAGKMH